MSIVGPRLRNVLIALGGALVVIALALPAVAAAAPEHSLEVEFGGSGEGAVGCEVEGGPLEECEAEYPDGTAVTVIAEPEFGSEFAAWVGECDSTSGGECEVEMDADKTIEVVFDLEEFELTIEAEGSGEGFVECQVDGGAYELCPEAETYPYGTEVALFAEEEPGSEFVEWTGDCSGIEAECELTVEEDLAVGAIFKPEPPFELTVEIGGTGAGTVECEVDGGGLEECEAEYEEGTEVVLVAEEELGSEFVEWNGECDSVSGDECEVEMNADKTVEAVFEPTPTVSLAIAHAGSGQGEVRCEVEGGPAEECEAEYPEGTELALVASAKSGSTFAGFSAGTGSASACSTSPCTFVIEVDSSVKATFNVESGGGGGGGSGGGSSGSATPPPPPAPPAVGTAAAAGTAKVKSGKAPLKLTCSGGPCQGTLTLTAKVKQGKKTKNLVIGKASFSLAAGASATLNVKLSGPAKQELAKGRSVKAKLSGSGVAARTVTLKPAKKKKG